MRNGERDPGSEKVRSRESRVFRYYGIGSEHGSARDASPAATARSGSHDHNDDDGRDDGQHVIVIVDRYADATRHE